MLFDKIASVYFIWKKYVYILALDMTSPWNQHCANSIVSAHFCSLHRYGDRKSAPLCGSAAVARAFQCQETITGTERTSWWAELGTSGDSDDARGSSGSSTAAGAARPTRSIHDCDTRRPHDYTRPETRHHENVSYIYTPPPPRCAPALSRQPLYIRPSPASHISLTRFMVY